MQGEIGRSYKIHILLANSNGLSVNIYESDWEKIVEPPTIDSIYFEKGQVQTLLHQNDGSYKVITSNGLNMFISAKPPVNQDYYYKFQTLLIQQYLLNEQPISLVPTNQQSPNPQTIFGWYSKPLTIIKSLKTGTSKNYTPVENYFVGFIPTFSFEYTEPLDSLYKLLIDSASDGSITTTSMLSVSKKIYQIFTEENTQINPTNNTVFDPIPTQLGTNIKCLSDTNLSVLGYFCAASKASIHYYSLLTSTSLYSYKIDTLPPIVGSTGSGPSDWWFYPNQTGNYYKLGCKSVSGLKVR